MNPNASLSRPISLPKIFKQRGVTVTAKNQFKEEFAHSYSLRLLVRSCRIIKLYNVKVAAAAASATFFRLLHRFMKCKYVLVVLRTWQ